MPNVRTVAHALEGSVNVEVRMETLMVLSVNLDDDLDFIEALVKNEASHLRLLTLAALAPAWSQCQINTLLAEVRLLDFDYEYVVEILAFLAPYAEAQDRVWQEAWEHVAICAVTNRARLYSNLIKWNALFSSQHCKTALATAQACSEPYHKAQSLLTLLSTMTKTQQRAVFKELVAVVQTVEEPKQQVLLMGKLLQMEHRIPTELLWMGLNLTPRFAHLAAQQWFLKRLRLQIDQGKGAEYERLSTRWCVLWDVAAMQAQFSQPDIEE